MLKKVVESTIEKLRRIARYFLSGSGQDIFRGMITLATGNIAARVIGLACIPLLTRLYAPAEFGLLAVYTSLVSILAPLVSLRYVLALPLPKRTGMAINLLALSFFSMLLLSSIAGMALWLLAPTILGLFSAEALIPYWYLIVIGTISVATYEALNLWSTRQRAYKVMAKSTVIQGLVGNGAKIALGLLNFKQTGLAFGHAASFSTSALYLLFKFKREIGPKIKFVNKRRLLITAKRFKNFPIFRLPSQLLLVFSTQAPVLFFSHTYNVSITGQLSMALLIIALPMFVIGDGMSKAYYAEAAKIGAKDPAALREITIDVSKKLFVASLLPASTLFFFGPEIFTIALGSEWKQAGRFASILSFYLVSQFITAPIVTIFNVIEKNGFFLALNTARAIGLLVVLYTLPTTLKLNPNETLTLYSAFMAIFYFAIYIFIVSYLANKKTKTPQ